MEAEEFNLNGTSDTIASAYGFTHPLARLIPYGPGAPLVLKALQKHVLQALDSNLTYAERLSSVLSIRPAIARIGLTAREEACVAIDLLECLNKLLLSPAMAEQLAWAYLDLEGIGLQGRKFSAPPTHPLPVLIRLEEYAGKPIQTEKALEVTRALELWTHVTMELAAKPFSALDAMCAPDLRSSLRILILFLLHADLDKYRATRAGRLDRFEDVGLSLWEELLSPLRCTAEYRPEDEQNFGIGIQRAVWHQLRSRSLSEGLAAASQEVSLSAARPSHELSNARHIVIQGHIPPGTSEEDRQNLARFERLQQPVVVTELPPISGLDAFEAKLTEEFPWAESAVTAIADDLRSRRLFGGVEVGMAPTLFVGLPGCGKSRLTRRIAEELGLPLLALSLAGMGDSRSILGTARGWSGGQPAPLLGVILDKLNASPLVILDELDKACSYTRNDVPPTSALLNLLEPENSRCWYDTYLQTACDLSKVMFLGTANTLSPISKPLLSRLRVVLVPEPRSIDFPAIARGALADIEREWSLPRGTFSKLSVDIPLTAARNAREIRALARAFLNDWARRSLGPSRLH